MDWTRHWLWSSRDNFKSVQQSRTYSESFTAFLSSSVNFEKCSKLKMHFLSTVHPCLACTKAPDALCRLVSAGGAAVKGSTAWSLPQEHLMKLKQSGEPNPASWQAWHAMLCLCSCNMPYNVLTGPVLTLWYASKIFRFAPDESTGPVVSSLSIRITQLDLELATWGRM